MTDFYSLLKQSIIERGIRDAGERDEIYAQARRAMIRQLWAFDPPLDEEEIDQRIGAFDVAVSDIEGDVSAAFAAPPDRRRPAPPPVDEEPEPAYEPEPEPEPPPAPARRRRPEPEAEAYRPAPTRALPAPGNGQRSPPGRDRQTTVDYEDRDVVPERQERRRDPPPAEPDYDEPPPRPARSRHPVPARVETYEPPPEEYEVEEDAPPPPRRSAGGRQRRSDDDAEAYLPAERQRALVREERWSGNALRRRPARTDQHRPGKGGRSFSEQTKIRILLGAIGACLVLLVAVGAYLLLPSRNDGVTVDIDVRREVSDAATAVRTAAQNLPIDQTFMLFDGRDPTVFETSANNPVRFDANAGIVRVASSPGSSGVKAIIGPGLATRLAGRNVRVTLVARSSIDTGAAGMRFAYQSGLAISHWQTASLGQGFQAVAMTWRVPTQRTDKNGDLLLIEPGVPGDGTGADIKSIRIDLLAQ